MINGVDDFIKANRKQQNYICTQYANNPYISAIAPVSQVVLPQGEIKLPSNIIQPPEVMAIPQPPPEAQSVNYNQITPYINSNSPVFQPVLTTKSGQVITMPPPESSKPVTQTTSQVVYVGPVKEFNPQVTPIEQLDNEVVKDMQRYYGVRAKYNEVLKKSLDSAFDRDKDSFAKKALKVAGVVVAAVLAYRFRAKLPFIGKFFKK